MDILDSVGYMKTGKVATRQTKAQIMQPGVWEMSTGVHHGAPHLCHRPPDGGEKPPDLTR